MDKVFVVQGVANRTNSAEDAIDRAIRETSQLVIDIVQARETLGVSAKVVDASISKAAQSLAALSESRRVLVEAHDELAEAQLRIGVRTKMVGSHDEITAKLNPEIRRAV